MCTAGGTTFDLTNILPWLAKHGTNPVTGLPLKSSELIKLNYTKNDEGEMVDPVTHKVFTDNTHIVALHTTGDVFAFDTIERLNIKAKIWRDLVNDKEFGRKDIITLQDPQNLTSQDLSTFKYIKDGMSTLTAEQVRGKDSSQDINEEILGNAAKVLKAKEAVALARSKRLSHADPSPAWPSNKSSKPRITELQSSSGINKSLPFNAAQHTTGKAAASFTSTGLTPHTSAERALLTDEEYMLKPRRVKQKGYARITTSLGELNIELQPEFAPRAVWNFVHLSKKGYYNGVIFHRNIRNFMIQGGDPTGTGKGGQSIWGKNFQDEFEGPSTHDARGVVSMANKGKNTNSSQFFITYRTAKHLDRKHTIFGKVVGGSETLSRLESAEVSDNEKRPIEDIVIKDITIFVDPFEEFQKNKKENDNAERRKEEIRQMGGADEDRTTWTGKRIANDGRSRDQPSVQGIGKYLHENPPGNEQDEMMGNWDDSEENPPKKRAKTGGFGNFDSW